MILLVNDANIIIDLLKIGLLDPFFQLEFKFHITDFVLEEIQEENIHELLFFIENGRLYKKTFDFRELIKIHSLRARFTQLSIADCSCLFHAKNQEACLLTGDGTLRRCAESQKIPVHGILWILEKLVEQKIISEAEAANKLKLLVSINPRLPIKVCKRMLHKWRSRNLKD